MESGAISTTLFQGLPHYAIPENYHPITEGGSEGVVGYQEDGSLQGLPCLLEGADHRSTGLGIQVAGGFVSQDQQRTVDESPGHGSALLLAAGDFRRILAPYVANTEYIAQLVGSLLGLGVNTSTDDSGQQNVFFDGETVQQQKILKHEAQLLVADPGQSVLPQMSQFRVTQSDGAAVGRDVAGYAVYWRSDADTYSSA